MGKWRPRRELESVVANVDAVNLGDGTDDRQPPKFLENAPGRISRRMTAAAKIVFRCGFNFKLNRVLFQHRYAYF